MSSRGDCLTGIFEPFSTPVIGIAQPISLEGLMGVVKTIGEVVMMSHL